MANERFKQLIDELYRATCDGRVRWQETVTEGVFRVGLGDGLVRIQTGRDDEGNGGVSIYLLNSKDQVVDELSAFENTKHHRLLLDLYREARSSALHLDKVVDSMLSDLKAGKVRELPPETQAKDFPF